MLPRASASQLAADAASAANHVVRLTSTPAFFKVLKY